MVYLHYYSNIATDSDDNITSESNYVTSDCLQLVRPNDLQKAWECHAFEFSQRLDAGESITFKYADSDALKLGGIYFVSMGRNGGMLPCTFILTKRVRKRYGDTIVLECEGTGASDLLNRKLLAPKYKSIKFRNLITALIDEARKYTPEISSDYQYIDDVDYTFLTFENYKKTLGEIFSDIRALGFSIYMRPDLKIVARKADSPVNFSVDYTRSVINGKIATMLDDNVIGYEYPATPYTSIIVKGGISENGNPITKEFIGTGEPTTGALVDLDTDVNFDSNFFLEPFTDATFPEFTRSELDAMNWQSRYMIYDTPIDMTNPIDMQIKLQVNNSTGRSYIMALNDGSNLLDTAVKYGIMIDGTQLKIIKDGIRTNIPVALKPFIQRGITSKSPDLLTFGIAGGTDDLAIGDLVSIAGISTTLSIAEASIVSKTPTTITINKPAIDGVITDALLTRTQNYLFRMIIEDQLIGKIYLSIENEPFQLINQTTLSLPDSMFCAVYNNQTAGGFPIQGNGVYEIDNLSLDCWFLDQGRSVRVYDNLGNKLAVCLADQADTVYRQAVCNKIDKNGLTLGQIEFISPSITPTVFDNTGTLTRIPLALPDTAFIRNGMRVLFNQQAYTITGYNVSLSNGYIDVSPALPGLPIIKTPVYIDTEIPAVNDQYNIEYVEAKELAVRFCATTACAKQYSFRETFVEATNVSDYNQLIQYAESYINDECEPVLSGQFNFIMGDECCGFEDSSLIPYIELPVIGEYISVSDDFHDASNVNTILQAMTIQTDTTLVNKVRVGYDYGAPKSKAPQVLARLLKRSGIFRGDANDNDTSLNMPCTLIDRVDIYDCLRLDEEIGYCFRSGIYSTNMSGSCDYGEPIETLILNQVTGYNFRSGIYATNMSGV